MREAATLSCARCGKSYPIEAFRVLGHGSRASYCTECQKQATRDWRAANRDEINAKRRAVYPRQVHQPKACGFCGETLIPTRPFQRYCGPKCKKTANRPGRAVSGPVRLSPIHPFGGS